MLKRDGITAVRDGILVDANEFIPTPAELTADAESQRHADELAKIAADYPLPHMDSVRLLYAYTTDGRVRVHQVVKSDKGAGADQTGPLLVPIASPFGVQARLRHADQADAFGLRCVVQDMNGKPRCVDFERGALAKLAAADIRRLLFDAGLRVEGDGETIVVQCLKAADPEREIVVVGRPGWHEFAGQPDLDPPNHSSRCLQPTSRIARHERRRKWHGQRCKIPHSRRHGRGQRREYLCRRSGCQHNSQNRSRRRGEHFRRVIR